MSVEALIDRVLQQIDCALAHPVLPPTAAHKPRSRADLALVPPPVAELYPIVLELYQKVKAAELFREPVNAFELRVPDYYARIAEPMSLRTVLDNIGGSSAGPSATLSGSRYGTSAEVLSDVSLIWRNCERFNGANSPITEAAHVCEQWLEERLRALEDSKPAPASDLEALLEDLQRVMEIDGVTDKLMAEVNRFNPKLLNDDQELSLDELNVGDLKALRAFIRSVDDRATGSKRPRE